MVGNPGFLLTCWSLGVGIIYEYVPCECRGSARLTMTFGYKFRAYLKVAVFNKSGSFFGVYLVYGVVGVGFGGF